MINLNKRFYFYSTRGFTLIELLLVMGLLLVMATLAIPNLVKAQTSLYLRQTVADLKQTMRYAQSRAVVQSQEVILVFDETWQSYQLLEPADKLENEKKDGKVFRQYFDDEGNLVSDLKNYMAQDQMTETAAYQPVATRMGRSFKIEKSIAVEGTQRQIRFYADGRIDPWELVACQRKKCFELSTRKQRGKIEEQEILYENR